jgi:hypothetical protein
MTCDSLADKHLVDPVKGIDHLVLCGKSLAAMREAYARLGFTLTPVAQHSFGTGNSLVQFDRAFLELLSIDDPSRIPEHGSRTFSFAAFNRDFLARSEGCSMLVLDSTDARADIEQYRARGLRTYELFEFTRGAKLASGEEATVGFSLAFVSCPQMPLGGFFTCQQHAPQHFWQPAYQDHANRALSVKEVAIAAERPLELRDFLEGFTGARGESSGGGFRVRTARGDISVLSPRDFERIYGIASPKLDEGPRFAGYTVTLPDNEPRRDLAGRTVELFGTAVRFEAVPVAAQGQRR